ncbi:MAG: 1-acyl-sn-glycerol-3-phosphate acyltransferase [Fermentimonas sp.]|nr:1-acyl-sn-glycerol-3-phosphate acyltransferase [Fermentimonas sp.]NLC85394.1 acyltransferase [Bacteroidales bacterium]HBT84720.1 acyltransferase [Porphyromonadaceae bacterium]MDD2930376.1 1-acyl-sn-glycerol-3-phosphate acyltransferase [Fermentimonas sp.]MDD3188735.1 1-acyl-sn-glycerol-3-phosphate acyltransferase [Fermentimonas sp.]
MANISKFILNRIMGWKAIDPFPIVPKCVLVVAPHTSNWDFVVGKLAYSSLGRQANFLIKAEWFVFPFNIFFKKVGGIPVKRDRSESLTTKLANVFQNREWMHLGITPEGTRKPVKEWKKGFYFIALKANVPILLVGLDYGKKEARVLEVFHPTGDYESDIIKIRSYYKDIKAKKPENYIPL